ncbi:MAG: putative DNA-binding domain-containing protein [Polyangiaceae bacterium]|nr:putative DNA-binding domain-containing protein [Polyangiaceae bacterium]
MTTPPALTLVQTFLKDAFQTNLPISENRELSAGVAKHVAGNERLTPAEQADLYRRQFFLRHIESLLEDHPGIAHYLGEEGFEAFATAYLAAYPPSTPSLRDLGAGVESFISSWSGIEEPYRPLLREMAHYELVFVDLFDAPDVPSPDLTLLGSLPQEVWLSCPFVFSPLLRLVEYRYPVPELRLQIRNGEVGRDLPMADHASYAVFRQTDVVRFERLTSPAFRLLKALTKGCSLVSACEQLNSTLTPAEADEVEAGLGQWCSRWAGAGWILAVDQNGASLDTSGPRSP